MVDREENRINDVSSRLDSAIGSGKWLLVELPPNEGNPRKSWILVVFNRDSDACEYHPLTGELCKTEWYDRDHRIIGVDGGAPGRASSPSGAAACVLEGRDAVNYRAVRTGPDTFTVVAN